MGTRGVVDGIVGTADSFTTPARALLNGVNRIFGGDPNYFKPVGSSVSNALNLPKPENLWEEIAYAISKGSTEGICTFWGASVLMAQKAATSAGSTFWDVVNFFKTGPATQITSGAGAELGVLAAQKTEAGPVGTIAAALAGTMAGGKVTPGGALTLATSAKNAAVAATSAEAKAARAAEGAFAGEVKAARAAKVSITQKADMFALTPEQITQVVEKSPYAKRASQVLEVEAEELGWSQTTVSYRKRRELPDGQKFEHTYDDIKADLHNNGWPKNKPIDAVIMPPYGKLTSIDNTRLTAVQELGGVDKYGRPIKPEVRIRRPDEALSVGDKLRFEKVEKGIRPQTWGEATRERIRNQSPKIPGQEYRLEQPPRVTGRSK